MDQADNLTLITKSDTTNPLRAFKMDAGQEQFFEAESVNVTNSGPEGTKMSDNEAFLAYMSKADAGDDDDE